MVFGKCEFILECLVRCICFPDVIRYKVVDLTRRSFRLNDAAIQSHAIPPSLKAATLSYTCMCHIVDMWHPIWRQNDPKLYYPNKISQIYTPYPIFPSDLFTLRDAGIQPNRNTQSTHKPFKLPPQFHLKGLICQPQTSIPIHSDLHQLLQYPHKPVLISLHHDNLSCRYV